MSDDEAVAIFCSDIHLSLKPPVARAGEENWLDAQAIPLGQLEDLARELDAPIFCAGDIFDRWNSSPELINFALRCLPQMYAIPGQHDLPMHSEDLIEKSAYRTLVRAGKIKNIMPGEPVMAGWRGRIWATSWAQPIRPLTEDPSKYLEVSLAHKYVWARGYSYPGAPKEYRVQRLSLEGYDLAVFGDNHKGFFVRHQGVQIFNCGGFMRRKSDEIDYMPQVDILYSSGKLKPHYLDTSADVIKKTTTITEAEEDMDLKEFLEGLENLETVPLDFKEAMLRYINEGDVSTEVEKIILEAME